MKFIGLSFVLGVHLSLINSVAIKPLHEKPKQDETHIGNVISLAQAVQEFQAMQLANDKRNKNSIKLAEKLIDENVISETTETYQLDTTIVIQAVRELVKNGHIAARGEVILNQLNDEPQVIIPSDKSEVVSDQKSDGESETMAETSKNFGARNHIGVNDAEEMHKPHDIIYEGIAPGTKRENQSKLGTKSKLHQNSSQHAPSSGTKASKHNHIVQNRKASDHIISGKPKAAPSSNHHKVESVMAHNKAVADTHGAGEEELETMNRNKLTNAGINAHENLAVSSKTTSTKGNGQQNFPKSNSDPQHKNLSPSIPSHNSTNHNKGSKIEKKNHEIILKKASRPEVSVIDTSQEDSLDSSNEDTDMIDPSKEATDLVDPPNDETDLVDPSNGDTVMVDPSREDTFLIDPSKEDRVMVDPSIDNTDLEDPLGDDTELLYHSKKDSELIISPKDNVNFKGSSQEENPLTEGKESLTPLKGDIKLQITPDSPSLKVDSDFDEKEVSSPEKQETEVNSKKADNTDPKPTQNHSKHQQRKSFVKKPVPKYRPAKLMHKPNDENPKNLDNKDIYPEPKVTNDKNSEPEPHDISLQNPESEAPIPKLPMKINPLMQKTELKTTQQDDPNVKESDGAEHKAEAVRKNQDAKDVLTYLKHESQASHKKKSASSNYIIAVSLILIISTILFAIVGVYYRQIRIDRQKYIGHMLLETEDDEDMQLFNRQTYHDEENHGYESWNAIR